MTNDLNAAIQHVQMNTTTSTFTSTMLISCVLYREAVLAASAHFSWLGASKSPLFKLDWEEVNWPNLCLSTNSRGQFPPLGLRALVDKDILHSSIHAAALTAMQPRLAEDAACPWRSILEEGDEFNYLRWQKSPPSFVASPSANCSLLKENCLVDEISQVHQYASAGLQIVCRLIWLNWAEEEWTGWLFLH